MPDVCSYRDEEIHKRDRDSELLQLAYADICGRMLT
jgi:hypothetical protein